MNIDMKDGIAIVEMLPPDTFDEYGFRLGPLVFLFLHARRLSSSQDPTFISEVVELIAERVEGRVLPITN